MTVSGNDSDWRNEDADCTNNFCLVGGLKVTVAQPNDISDSAEYAKKPNHNYY